MEAPEHIQQGLYNALPSIEAIVEINARKSQSSMSSEQLHSLVYRATLDEDQAEDAQVHFLMSAMKKGLTPDV